MNRWIMLRVLFGGSSGGDIMEGEMILWKER